VKNKNKENTTYLRRLIQNLHLLTPLLLSPPFIFLSFKNFYLPPQPYYTNTNLWLSLTGQYISVHKNRTQAIALQKGY
jgi:hypothetical protein